LLIKTLGGLFINAPGLKVSKVGGFLPLWPKQK
jgi:hypothetical protein